MTRTTRDDRPKHYHLFTAIIVHTVDGADKQRYINILMELPNKAISQSALDSARLAAVQQLLDRGIVTDPASVDHIAILGVSYLGIMKPADFHDQPAVASALN